MVTFVTSSCRQSPLWLHHEIHKENLDEDDVIQLSFIAKVLSK
jgi:hypothetical protein